MTAVSGGGGLTGIANNEAAQGQRDIAAAREQRNVIPAGVGVEEAFFHKLSEIIKNQGFVSSI